MNTETTPQEIEAVLFVCAHEPHIICERIASLTELAGYRLRPQATEHIHDVYFDTRARTLGQSGLGLRLRQKNAQTLITLKGDARANEWGGVTRFEREVAWSRDGLRAISAELNRRSIHVGAGSFADDANPSNVMRGLGFVVIQDRETRRQIRHVIMQADDTTPAELAIDAMVYHFQDGDVFCHEIEVEAKSNAQLGLLKLLIEKLAAMFAPALRRWPHGKLATGMALEQLLRATGRAALLAAHNQLRPEACDKIDNYLRLFGAV